MSRTEDRKALIKQAIPEYFCSVAQLQKLKRERRVVAFVEPPFAHGKARTD